LPPEPLILGFDTSAAHCAAALVSGGRILAERAEEMTRGQAERLMSLLEEILAEAGAGWPDLVAVGVGAGPGNFTGVRVSVAAARGLALALGVPAVGVTGFDAMAFGQEADAPLLVSLPTLRGQVAVRQPGSGAAVVICAPENPPDQFRASGFDVIGAEAAQLAAATGGRVRVSDISLAGAIALSAEARRLEPVKRPVPMYLRPADAAPPREAPPVLMD
jgi:tRNA threonylcarbamoyl adenosine modification protein YeaZ